MLMLSSAERSKRMLSLDAKSSKHDICVQNKIRGNVFCAVCSRASPGLPEKEKEKGIDMWRQPLLIFVAIVLLSGCVLIEKAPYLRVTRVRFENASYYPITNIRLRVDSIKEVVSCSELLSTNDCYTDFPGQEYLGNPIIISWEQNGRSWTTGEIFAEMPQKMTKDAPLTCAVIIGNQGSYKAHFAQ